MQSAMADHQSSRWNMVPTSVNICVGKKRKEDRKSALAGGNVCVLLFFVCVLMFVSRRLCSRCVSFCLTEYRGVKLPFITSIMHGCACHMCDQRQDFACMVVASPSWSPLPETSSKGPSSQWDRRSDCQPTWQLDDHMKSPHGKGWHLCFTDWAAYRNVCEDFF